MDISLVCCPQCGKMPPPDWKGFMCQPCANAGHGYRLVDAATLRKMAAREHTMGGPQHPVVVKRLLKYANNLEKLGGE